MLCTERKGGTNKNGVCKTDVHVVKGTEKAMTDTDPAIVKAG